MNISELQGLRLEAFHKVDNDLILITASGRKFRMCHNQDCCERVVVEDIQGDIQRAVGELIIDATENTNSENVKEGDESATWTYYTIRTQSETIVIRWYGSSNGYYYETADFEEEK